MKYLEKALLKWDRGMELHDAPWSTLLCRGLLPWLVIMCKVVWKEVCPSIVVSVIRQVSMLDIGFTVVKWLTCCLLWCLGSGICSSHYGFWLLWFHCLYSGSGGCSCLKLGGVACHFCSGGLLTLPGLVSDVLGWTLWQWLQHLWLVCRLLNEVLDTIFIDGGIFW